jgi:signal transduction histidine kinase
MRPSETEPGPGSPIPPKSHRLRTALLIAGVWFAIGLFLFSQSLIQMTLGHDPTPRWHSLLSWMTGVSICALATPLVLWLGHRFPLQRRRWLGTAAAHAVFSVGYAIAQLVLESLILPRFHVFPAIMKDTVSTFVFLLVIGFHQNVMTYWTILALQAGWDYYRRFLERQREALRLEVRASELQSQLAWAQLGALKAQLQPHFLFNTLNAIMTLVRQQKGPQAERMLGRLADLLRCVLDDIHAQEIPLRRELEYLRLYLAIEEVRFEDRLRVDITADPALLDALVPHMCLQPVVENAIRHGLGGSAGASRIAVRAWREDARLLLSVEDDGPGLPAPEAAKPPGIGLANTRARLARLYGDAAHLTLAAAVPHGVVATVELPYREGAEAPREEEGTYVVHDADRR